MTESAARHEVRALWDAAWPQPVDRESPEDTTILKLTILDTEFEMRLLAGPAPLTSAAVLAELPLTGYLVHAAWSGEVVRGVGPIDLGDVGATENGTACCAPGDVVFSPEHRELSIIYGDNDMRMSDGPVVASVFGRIERGVGELQRIGRDIRLFGAVPFTISR
ncbi:hypothetical protein Aph01nite_17100 [Acrocarpospora phusangensis]|uniref:Cyclophilin TM1367-like domain-containing protein n=1 Tax=Acrocarpospora phusangensis TaxID=1070424 RepID=A0A919Q9V3_9ACTN|nr:DUF3830 family protein [Acrocarpospora phusangensis]GIH23400.1 hypothetical protein Aph01nite_17100 [Acrocarpospora phusangensis]